MSVALGLLGLVAVVVLWQRRMRAEQRLRARLLRVLGMPASSPRRVARTATVALAGHERMLQRLGELLEQAALPMRPEEYLRLAAAATAAGMALGLLIRGPGGGVILGGAAVAGMVLWPQRRIAARRAQFSAGLPGALQSMAASLGAGLSVQEGISSVARDAPDPVGPEFERVARATQIGVPLQQSVLILARRVRLPEIAYLSAALRLSAQTGADLGFILGQMAGALRAREEAAAELRALTAQGRMSTYILTALPVLVSAAFYLIDPQYGATLFGTRGGWVLLGISAVLLTMGWIISRRITEVI